MEIFSKRIEYLRIRKGLTKKEMAEKLGISQTYYGRFEKGTGQPNLEALSKLPDILGESIDFLLGLEMYDQEGMILFRRYSDAKLQYYRAKERIKEVKSELEKHDITFAEKHFIEQQESFRRHIELIPFAEHVEPIIAESEDGNLKLVPFKREMFRVKR